MEILSMTPEYTESKFVPSCFKKEISNFSSVINTKSKKQNIIRDIKSLKYNGKKAYIILKNLENYFHNSEIIKNAQRLIKVSRSCDVYLIKTQLRRFLITKSTQQFRMIRFYSYSNRNNCYIFLLRFVDEKNEKIKYATAKIMIPVNENRVIITYKKSKRSNMKCEIFESFFDALLVLFQNEKDEIKSPCMERLSTVEAFDEDEFNLQDKYMKKKRSNTSSDNSTKNEEILQEDEDCDDCIDFEEIDLEQIEQQSTMFNLNQGLISRKQTNSNDLESVYESPLEHTQEEEEDKEETDPELRKIRKMTEKGIISHGYYKEYQELRDYVENKYGKGFFSRNEIIRYIYGWRGNLQGAKDYMDDLIVWRREYQPSKITEEEFQNYDFDFSSLLTIACQDIHGRPILLLRASKLQPKKIDVDMFVRYLIFTLESAIQKMPSNIDKFLLVIDIQNAGTENFAMNHLKKIKEVTSRYYVERLSNIVIINKGFFFGILWKIVSQFLDERVLAKLIVVDNSNINWLRNILGSTENISKVNL
jgi:hypothetical protein